MLKILHTADWHLGCFSRLLDEADAQRLARARLTVIERILHLARRHGVHAVLCAGDLFDSPDPGEDWWRGLLSVFDRFRDWTIPVVLLPGNHDPLTPNSVYASAHPFRQKLPVWVHVVDREDFELALGTEGVVVARPCTSSAGDTDLALALPGRPEGDSRIRIGLVHGSTFDLPGYQTNFPIAKDAAARRGLDYLAIGDTHAFREVVPGIAPTIYPGAPEPTNFAEPDAGCVAVVLFSRPGAKPRVNAERVGQWTWREVTIQSVSELRSLADEELMHTVLRLRLDLSASLVENDEIEQLVASLKGTAAVLPRAGAVVVDRDGLRIEVVGTAFPDDLPDTVRETLDELRARAAHDAAATRAVRLLHQMVRELQ